MEIKELGKKPNIEQNKRLKKRYAILEKLINELRKRSIPSEIANSINEKTEEINSFSGSNKHLKKEGNLTWKLITKMSQPGYYNPIMIKGKINLA